MSTYTSAEQKERATLLHVLRASGKVGRDESLEEYEARVPGGVKAACDAMKARYEATATGRSAKRGEPEAFKPDVNSAYAHWNKPRTKAEQSAPVDKAAPVDPADVASDLDAMAPAAFAKFNRKG